ncbi:MAG: fasciclin domain-containing protein [Flavobacteriales bacterium]|nr:fasciclin domain-containing protein [Flavobacteriales bacterium]
MKKSNLFLFSILLAGSLFVSSCSDDDDDPVVNDPVTTTPSIVDLATGTDDLNMLEAALVRADLVSALQGDGPFTVFAPTNDAFQKLLDSNPNWNSIDDIDVDVLKSVLLFHVVSGNVKSGDLTDGYVSTLSTGPNDKAISLKIQVSGGVKFNNSASPSKVDVAASNGVVHIIDAVMMPPSVVDIALGNENFSSLVAALTRSDLSADFVGTLSGDGPFTVFAPTNAAFQALLDSNPDWNTLADIPVATLEAVLSYHVVNMANVQSAELTDAQEITTLGGKLTVDLDTGAQLLTSSDQRADIIITDVQGTNGVIHVVNTVLLP